MGVTVEDQADTKAAQLLHQFLTSIEDDLAPRGLPELESGSEVVLCTIQLSGVRYKLSCQSCLQATSHYLLSPREQEVVRLVMKGLPTRGIAAVLDISPWTVITHMRRIFSKLGVSSRAEMVAQVLQAGVLT